jgi:iron complex outermembrane recepter protein
MVGFSSIISNILFISSSIVLAGEQINSVSSKQKNPADIYSEKVKSESLAKHTLADIPSAPLGVVLQQLSKQTEIQFAYPSHLALGKVSKGCKAAVHIEDALKQILGGTGLVFERIDSNTVTLHRLRSSKLILPIDNVFDELDHSVIESVIVTGARAQSRAAIVAKYQSTRIMDALSAGSIGQLPDINMADAFRRLPGANTINDSDEGQYVTVRGVDASLNFVTIDGMAMATDHGDSRRVNMETIPTTAAIALQVYKSQTPDLDGNAIGGTLNMTTRSAYDVSDAFYQFNAMLSKYSLDDVPDDDDGLGGDIDFTYSTTFGNASQFGVVISGMYSEKRRDEQKWDPRYIYVDQADGSQAPFRNRFNTAQYTNTWIRRGASAKFEVKPTEQVYSYLHAFHYSRNEDEDRDIWSIQNQAEDNVNPAEDNVILNSQGGGSTAQGRGHVSYNHRPTRRSLSGAHAHIEFDLDELQRINVDLARSEGTYERGDRGIYWQTDVTSEMGYSYVDGTVHPDWRLTNPVYGQNAAQYFLNNFKDELVRVDDSITELKADHTYNDGENSVGLGTKVGVKYRKNYRVFDRSMKNIMWSGAQRLTMDNFIDPISFSPEHFPYPMFFQNQAAFFSFYSKHQNQFYWDETEELYNDLNGDFVFDEKVYAAYAMTTYKRDALAVYGGVRFEKTNLSNRGKSYNAQNGMFNTNTTGSQYENVLPSLNIIYQFDNNLTLRLALSKSIGRADPGATKARETNELDEGIRTISRGNPDLKPRQSNNFDISLERYFKDWSGMLSLAVFHKEIDDLIFGSEVVSFDVQSGITTIIKQSKNADKAKLTGYEIGIVINSFDSIFNELSNVGMAANATWINAEMTYVSDQGRSVTIDHLAQQPDFMANVALFYHFHHARGEARIAYNFTDRYSEGLKVNGLDRDENVWESYEQIDAQLRYALTETLVLSAKIRNLRDHSRVRKTGYDLRLTGHEVHFGRSFWFGFTYTY